MDPHNTGITAKSFLSNTVWNTLGSIVYFACQWLITVIVVWLYDDFTNAGNLALAMNITNVFYCIAVYNMRTYQVSDIRNEYTDSEYVLSRIATCLGAVLLCALFLLLPGYSRTQVLIIICYMGFRTVEAFVDVLHGIVHKHRRLDFASVSMISRGILMLAAFSVFGYFFDLLPAIIAMTVVTLLFALLYDTANAKKMAAPGSFSRGKMFALLKRCFPLMIVTLVFVFIVSYTRYALERIHGTQALGAYAAAVTPAVAVQVGVQFILAPLVNLFAVCVKTSDNKRFIRLFILTFTLFSALTFVVAVAAHFFGQRGLTLLFGESISPYAYLLPGAVIAAGLTALLWLMNLVFTTLRDIKGLLWGSLSGVVVCVAASEVLLHECGLMGANYAMFVCQGFILTVLLVRLAVQLYTAQ